jgi:hypothetical protein
MSMPPAISANSETQPIPAISGSSHASKNTLGRLFNPSACSRVATKRLSEASDELVGPITRVRHCPDYPYHIKDLSDASLIKGMDIKPPANEIRGNVRLEIRERQDEVGLQGQNLVDVRRREGTPAQLLTASPWRRNNIARDPGDAVLLAEQIQRLDGLFGEADNSAGRKHGVLALD